MSEELKEIIETTEQAENKNDIVINDLEIENKALKEILEKNKETMEALKNELQDVKKMNAKLLLQFDTKQEVNSDDALASFSKYKK